MCQILTNQEEAWPINSPVGPESDILNLDLLLLTSKGTTGKLKLPFGELIKKLIN